MISRSRSHHFNVSSIQKKIFSPQQQTRTSKAYPLESSGGPEKLPTSRNDDIKDTIEDTDAHFNSEYTFMAN